MLEAADVGVSIVTSNKSSKYQDGDCHLLYAVADYSFGQFKHLKSLILVHGRESYRKISLVILINFFKVVLMTTPVVLFSIHSGFSQQRLFSIEWNWVIDLALGLLPVIMFVFTDLEFDKEALIRNPVVYEDG